MKQLRRLEASWAQRLPWLSRSNAFTLGCALIVFGLLWSRSAITIGTALISLCALVHHDWRIWLRKIVAAPIFWLPLVFFALAWLSHLTSSNLASSYPKLITRLPIPALVIGFAAVGALSGWQRKVIEWLFLLSLASMAGIMLVEVALDYDTFLALLAKGKAIPTPNGILPLSFGVMCAFGVFLAAQLALTRGSHTYWEKRSAWLIVGVLWLSLHVLGNRTGLLCLYASLLFVGLVLALVPKYRNRVLKTAAFLVLLMSIGWFALPTLRSKVYHGIHDVQYFNEGKDLNDWSIGPRLAAAQVTWQVFLKYPVFGIGLGDVNQAVQDQYNYNDFRLRPDHRIGPHNQWLETMAGQGLLGLLSLGAMIFYPLFIKSYRYRSVVVAQIVCTTVGMLTDSSLEVQLGLNFFAFFGLFTLTQYGEVLLKAKPAIEINPHQPR